MVTRKTDFEPRLLTILNRQIRHAMERKFAHTGGRKCLPFKAVAYSLDLAEEPSDLGIDDLRMSDWGHVAKTSEFDYSDAW